MAVGHWQSAVSEWDAADVVSSVDWRSVVGGFVEEVESDLVALGGQVSDEEVLEVLAVELPVVVRVVGLHEFLTLFRSGVVGDVARSIEIGDQSGSFLGVDET